MSSLYPGRPVPKRKYKPRDASVTSAMMSRVRSRDSRAEVVLRSLLWRMGFRFRVHRADLPGKPDVVFPRLRVALFVDGDFWHGRVLKEGGESSLRNVIRGERFAWWRDKLGRNVERDDRVCAILESEGWLVIRVWESTVLRDAEDAARAVARTLSKRRSELA